MFHELPFNTKYVFLYQSQIQDGHHHRILTERLPANFAYIFFIQCSSKNIKQKIRQAEF